MGLQGPNLQTRSGEPFDLGGLQDAWLKNWVGQLVKFIWIKYYLGGSMNGLPQMDALSWNILLRWMISAYPYFRKPLPSCFLISKQFFLLHLVKH